MVCFGEKSVLRKVSGPVYFLLIVCVLTVFNSCQSVRPSSSQEITNLANELEEANQKLEEIYHRVSVVQFMVDNHERTIADLESLIKESGVNTVNPRSPEKKKDVFAVTEDKSLEKSLLAPEEEPDTLNTGVRADNINSSPEYLYNQAFSALKSKDYTKAISLFRTLVSRFPAHNLADNSIYWTGEIFYTQNEYSEAIKTFQGLIEKYPEGGKVADALLKIGFSYYAIKDKDNAVRYLKQVVVDHPFSGSGSKAEAMLSKIE